jgi:hypothetical protein
VIIAIALFSLIVLSVVPAWASRRRDASPRTAGNRHPESMTASLSPGEEEYLAWLADHHWPDDEYLDLERDWRAELEPDPSMIDMCPVCPGCGRPGHDGWPCPECGMRLHSGSGYGMRRRKIAKPYRTRDMNSESVIAEWICSRCSSIVGLDVDRGDEETGHGLHQ